MEELTKLVSNINSFIWGMYCLIPLLCGVGIYFTIRLKFIQVRKFGQAVRMLFGDLSLKGKRADKHGMSSFQSVATAIAAQVGTGNPHKQPPLSFMPSFLIRPTLCPFLTNFITFPIFIIL